MAISFFLFWILINLSRTLQSVLFLDTYWAVMDSTRGHISKVVRCKMKEVSLTFDCTIIPKCDILSVTHQKLNGILL